MNINLMYRDRNYDPNEVTCYGANTLIADLELDRILDLMADDSPEIRSVCSQAMFTPLTDLEDIAYRQEAVRDAIENIEIVNAMYQLITDLQARQDYTLYWVAGNVRMILAYEAGITFLKRCGGTLGELRKLIEERGGSFKSAAFKGFAETIKRELDHKYIQSIRYHLKELNNINYPSEILLKAKLTVLNDSAEYVLCRREKNYALNQLNWNTSKKIKYDDIGLDSNLSARCDIALNEAVSIFGQVSRWLDIFYNTLRSELAFYIGAVKLKQKLDSFSLPVTFPTMLPIESCDRSWRGLYNMNLALYKGEPVVSNDHAAKDKMLYIVTGANQGGKSTFLRSVGQAQLMAQCGLYVGAEEFTAPVRNGIFSHFKRGEDQYMKSGKLDEELKRMDMIVARLKPGGLVLQNEAFVSTNEREGSEIGGQITRALIDSGVEMLSVSHMYAYAMSFADDKRAVLMRAGRLESGERNFKIEPGEPLETAFGKDVYYELFGAQSGAKR